MGKKNFGTITVGPYKYYRYKIINYPIKIIIQNVENVIDGLNNLKLFGLALK